MTYSISLECTFGVHLKKKLRKFFEQIKKFNLIQNLEKCTFGVEVTKLMGFLVSDKGIEVDIFNIKSILDMPSPISEK